MSIADWRMSIADGHWKELLHHLFNRQSAISDCRFSIADGRLLMDIGRSCHTALQSSISNQQSAIGGCG